MRIQRRISVLAVTMAAVGAVTPAAGAFDAGDIGGGPATAPATPQHVRPPARTHHVLGAGRTQVLGARFVPERVWQEINDAMFVKLMNRH